MPKQRFAPSGRFIEWLNEVGDTYVADHLGVSRQSVYFWRTGQSRPDPARLGALLTLAGGLLTASDIFPPRTEP